jgi:hypothetical protein
MVRSNVCDKGGDTSLDKSGNRLCTACSRLSTNESFARNVRRARDSKSSRFIRERGPQEQSKIRNLQKKKYTTLLRSNSKLQREVGIQAVLAQSLKGQINFKKIAKALQALDQERNNIDEETPVDKQGKTLSSSDSSSNQPHTKQELSRVRATGVYTSSEASRSLKLQFLGDILTNLEAHDKRGNRFSEKAKRFFKIIRLVGGPQVYRILSQNLGAPAERSLRRDEPNPPWRAGFHDDNWKSLRRAYKSVRDANPGIEKCLVLSAEDETGVRVDPSWDPRTDTITGFCGVECENKCKKVTSCRKNKICNPVHQCTSNEHVFIVGNDEDAYDRVKEICKTYRKGTMLRVLMLNPLDKRWPRLVCAHFDTCNAFDAADYVKSQWREVESKYKTYLEDIVGPLVGFASDGDSRRRKLMLHYAMGADSQKLVCFCCDPRFLQRGCERVRYGLDDKTFTMKAWKFIITDRDTGEKSFRIRYIGDQDYIHCGKKLVNCASHPSRYLRLGPTMYAHMNAVTTNMRTQSNEAHGLRVGDDSRDGYRAMDWPSAVRLTHRKHLTSLSNLCEGNEDLVPNEGVRGMLEFLKIVRMYISIFADTSLTHKERVKRAGCVVTYLRLWKCYVEHDPSMDTDTNFITREAFQDCLLSCHAAVLLIMANRDLTPTQRANLDRSGTDCCEDFFSFSGSSVANKRVYSTLDVRQIIHNHLTVVMYAAIAGIELPGSTKHRRQFFDHEGEEIIGPEAWCTDAALLAMWKQGVNKGYKLATAHGMRPNHYRNVAWWNHPERYCDAKFACARGDGINDDYWENDEDDDDDDDDDEDMDNDHDDSSSSEDDDDNVDGRGPGQCLQAIVELNVNPGEGDVNQAKICQTMYVPHLNRRVHKATVMRDLASGSEKVSADRVVRARGTNKLRAEEKAELELRNLLGKEDWLVGLDTDVAVKVRGDGGRIQIEVGRVKRIIRRGRRVTEYKRQVKLTTQADRDKHYKEGVHFRCHFYRRVGTGKEQVYAFGTNPFTTEIGPHMIVSPVIMKYQKDNKWKLNRQSQEIVKDAQAGKTVVPMCEYILRGEMKRN